MEYQLRERVVLIAGPLTTTTQSLMMGLTEQGADVALLDENANKAEKFCNQLMDQREVKAKHGRAIAIQTDLTNPKQIKEHVGQVAQSLGGIDIFIDAQVCNEPTAIEVDQQLDEASVEKLEALLSRNLKSTLMLTQTVVGYLKSRKKGRILFLANDCVLKNIPADLFQNTIRSGLVAYAQTLSKQLQEYNVTINVLCLGVTEEYLLAHYSGVNIKEALEKHKQYDFFARITEPDKITNSIIFLGGPSGLAISGQVIRLN